MSGRWPGLDTIHPSCREEAGHLEATRNKDTALAREELRFLRDAVEHLDDKAKADLKVALYGSGFFLALSLIEYGELAHCSLIVSAIDIWYFMSWGSDQLQLIRNRDQMNKRESQAGLEHGVERHANFTYERILYYSTPLVILAFFIAGLIRDYHVLQHPFWKPVYFTVVILSFLAVITVLLIGFMRRETTRLF